MKKRILSLILGITLLLCGCAGNGGAGTDSPDTTADPFRNSLQKSDPAQDDTLNILMIGNSFSYYFTDELYGLAKAADMKIRICNIYYSGCTLKMHWTWWKDGTANYRFCITDENGRTEQENMNLENCLRQGNWDVISLQEGSSNFRTKPVETALAESQVYRKDLTEYLRTQFPKSQLYWHQTWAYQVGFDREGYQVADQQEQAAYHNRVRAFSLAICEEDKLLRIPSGEAWVLARQNSAVGDNLCARAGINGGLGDYYHDGDLGGGQYLNACVWFETLTGQSCIGNTFRPKYSLSEEMVQALQQAAHTAVESMEAE